VIGTCTAGAGRLPGSALTVAFACGLWVMVALIPWEGLMSEKRKYRTFTPDQKLEIVLAGIRGDRSVRDVRRDDGVGRRIWTQSIAGSCASCTQST
jgi:hypothetical protein